MPLTFHTKILTIFEKSTKLTHLKQLQSHLLIHGHGQNQLYSFKLLRFCAIAMSDLRYARSIFDSHPTPNIYLYTAMVTAYSSHCDPDATVSLFRRMLRETDPSPNEFVYPHLARCSGGIGLMGSIEGIVRKTGFDGFGVVKTALVDGYSRCSEIKAARNLFDELRNKRDGLGFNVVSWTVMLSAYMRVGSIGDAVCLFDEMPVRDVPSWNAVIAGCTQNGFFTESLDFFRKMVAGTKDASFIPNQTTIACVLSTCGHLGMLQHGKSIHGFIYKFQIHPNTFVSNALIDMYGKCGRLSSAKSIFNASTQTLTTWNSLINCLALHGDSTEAMKAFEEMQSIHRFLPDEVTFVGLLNACTHAGLVDTGRKYFTSMIQVYKIAPRIEHYGCIIDLLSRAGRFAEVMSVISDMKLKPDELVWGSLLNGCRIHRNATVAKFAVSKLLELDPWCMDYRVMQANLYSECGNWEEVGCVRKVMNGMGKKKLPGCSWIEAEGVVHQFYSKDKTHPKAEDIWKMLDALSFLL
ncbi:pentatricopeptide repeat protein [Zostera marina]|uniref:Pentatricopeptide repeat protein n=1 Tax=Zostera marina TaxID=29655 RepID=A0A0K9PK74_ZOSMR|nr:pentatricopeptide repeat protein [Zostera marina]